MTVLIVPCPTCQGEGSYEKHAWIYEPGCGHGHDGGVSVTCETCEGAGVVEEETAARTLADLEQEDFDMLEASCR